MTLFLALVTIIQSFAISLGVGCSTLAIVNFFVAIADGKIDETERRMMGVVYTVLRIAMVAIFVSTLYLVAYELGMSGYASLSHFSIAVLITLGILFINAVLMTKRIMPSTLGPAIQAGSWYTLGTLMALEVLAVTEFKIWIFLIGYLTWIVLAVSIVNGVMAILKEKKHNQEE